MKPTQLAHGPPANLAASEIAPPGWEVKPGWAKAVSFVPPEGGCLQNPVLLLHLQLMQICSVLALQQGSSPVCSENELAPSNVGDRTEETPT